MHEYKIGDQADVVYDGGGRGTITHIRDVDDAPNTYRLLRTEDGWYLGWYTEDQMTPVLDAEAETDETTPELEDETESEDSEEVTDA